MCFLIRICLVVCNYTYMFILLLLLLCVSDHFTEKREGNVCITFFRK